jgi:hypothetical protein
MIIHHTRFCVTFLTSRNIVRYCLCHCFRRYSWDMAYSSWGSPSPTYDEQWAKGMNELSRRGMFANRFVAFESTMIIWWQWGIHTLHFDETSPGLWSHYFKVLRVHQFSVEIVHNLSLLRLVSRFLVWIYACYHICIIWLTTLHGLFIQMSCLYWDEHLFILFIWTWFA